MWGYHFTVISNSFIAVKMQTGLTYRNDNIRAKLAQTTGEPDSEDHRFVFIYDFVHRATATSEKETVI